MKTKLCIILAVLMFSLIGGNAAGATITFDKSLDVPDRYLKNVTIGESTLSFWINDTGNYKIGDDVGITVSDGVNMMKFELWTIKTNDKLTVWYENLAPTSVSATIPAGRFDSSCPYSDFCGDSGSPVGPGTYGLVVKNLDYTNIDYLKYFIAKPLIVSDYDIIVTPDSAQASAGSTIKVTVIVKKNGIPISAGNNTVKVTLFQDSTNTNFEGNAVATETTGTYERNIQIPTGTSGTYKLFAAITTNRFIYQDYPETIGAASYSGTITLSASTPTPTPAPTATPTPTPTPKPTPAPTPTPTATPTPKPTPAPTPTPTPAPTATPTPTPTTKEPFLVFAITPNSRNAQLGTPVTLFMSVISYGTGTATGVSITQGSGLPATVSFQQWNKTSGASIGSTNTPVDMVAGGTYDFLLTINATSAFNSSSMTFNVSSTNGATAPIGAVNTLIIAASATPIADVIMISTNTNVSGPLNNWSYLAVATMNVGAAIATNSTFNVVIPSSITGLITLVNQTNATTGAVIGPATGLTIAPGDTPTFAVFFYPTKAIAPDPTNNRVTLQMVDGTGKVIGAQSVAVSST